MTSTLELFWQEKTVFITGHTGFKGSWLSLWLQQLGAKVVGFSLPPPTTPNLFTIANVSDGMTSLMGNICDYPLLKAALLEHSPDIVIHMAAQSLVRYSYQEPIETYATNVMGTVHLLEAVKQTDSVKAVVNVTTDKCYDNQEWWWGYRETDRLGGCDPYSSSKACSELVTSAYHHAFYQSQKIAIASARAGNVIGGGDWALDRLIPDMIRAAMDKRSVKIRYPEAKRPWQHVLEPLYGYLLLAEHLYHSPLQYSGAWNFGPNEHDVKSVRWVADFITKQLSHTKGWELDTHPHHHESLLLMLDCAKAKTKLHWQPQWSIEKALEETMYWYQAYYSNQCMRDVTLLQMTQFLNQANTNIQQAPFKEEIV